MGGSIAFKRQLQSSTRKPNAQPSRIFSPRSASAQLWQSLKPCDRQATTTQARRLRPSTVIAKPLSPRMIDIKKQFQQIQFGSQ
jgi:hypothetical protein